MSRDEFIQAHGQEAWVQLVEPMQQSVDPVRRQNANYLAHENIRDVLKLLGLSGAKGLIEAKESLKEIIAA